MEYDVVYEEVLEDLIEKVNEKIKLGWIPRGSCQVVVWEWENARKGYLEHNRTYYQTMVKRR